MGKSKYLIKNSKGELVGHLSLKSEKNSGYKIAYLENADHKLISLAFHPKCDDMQIAILMMEKMGLGDDYVLIKKNECTCK